MTQYIIELDKNEYVYKINRGNIHTLDSDNLKRDGDLIAMNKAKLIKYMKRLKDMGVKFKIVLFEEQQ